MEPINLIHNKDLALPVPKAITAQCFQVRLSVLSLPLNALMVTTVLLVPQTTKFTDALLVNIMIHPFLSMGELLE
jgi:hypothetical protein